MKEHLPLPSVSAWGATDVGRERDNNEDSFLLLDLKTGATFESSSPVSVTVERQGLLLLVADGMGGHEAGEVASRMAVDEISRYLRTRIDNDANLNRQRHVQLLQDAVRHANTLIYRAGHEDTRHRDMGTTVTAALLYDGAAFFAQVGDSRGYLLRGNVLARMTRDQSLVAELTASGELEERQATAHPLKNVLLQALGAQPAVTVPVSFIELRQGDWLVLCSDGLTNMVTEEELGDIVAATTDPQAACQTLIAAANDNGGQDNITVIVVRCDGPGFPPPNLEEEPQAREFVVPRKRWHLPGRETVGQSHERANGRAGKQHWTSGSWLTTLIALLSASVVSAVLLWFIAFRGGDATKPSARVESRSESEMVAVPEGEFLMGCQKTMETQCNTDDESGRQETVKAFTIDRTEVSVAAYGRCVEAGACTVPGTGGACTWQQTGREQHPVNCVDWEQARTYCAWVGKRLPTEMEWEKAARGTDGRMYPWGNQWDIHKANTLGNDDGYTGTAPVGAFLTDASPYGALDMGGNVQEWTADWYDAEQRFRSLRGGSWNYGQWAARLYFRNRLTLEARDVGVGFRCAQ